MVSLFKIKKLIIKNSILEYIKDMLFNRDILYPKYYVITVNNVSITDFIDKIDEILIDIKKDYKFKYNLVIKKKIKRNVPIGSKSYVVFLSLENNSTITLSFYMQPLKLCVAGYGVLDSTKDSDIYIEESF